MSDMPYMTVRIRRKDQNFLLGMPIDHWQTYSFPTIDAAVLFGIGSARDGDWEVKFEDGITLRKKEDNVAGKSLYGAKPIPKKKSLYTKPAPKRTVPALHDVPDGTDWMYTDSLPVYLVTTLADGLEVAWDVCGACSQGVMACTCTRGISAPNSIRYIAMKTNGVAGGQKWDQVDTSRKRTTDAPTSYVKTWQTPTVTPAPVAKPAGKSLRKPIVEDEAPVTAPDIDMRKVDSDAATMADDLEAKLAKRLGGVKSLRAASTPSSVTSPGKKSLPKHLPSKASQTASIPVVPPITPVRKFPRRGR